ncbi:MAG: ABC transporter ATP-binding protein, partial [Bacteroidota bacterium]
PKQILEFNTQYFIPNHTVRSKQMYRPIMVLLGPGLASMPFIRIPIYPSARGITKSSTEHLPLVSLIGANKEIQNALLAADRFFEILDLEREEQGEKIMLTNENIGEITFENVCFSYGTRVEVFKYFRLQRKKGEITAFVGESGLGKFTLVSLLQNIYPINEGSIGIGNTNLNYLDNESLRKLVAVVPQKIELFAGNVIENIAIGELEPDMDSS